MPATFSETFVGGAVPSIQFVLLSLAEYIATNISATTIDDQESILQAIQLTLMNMINVIDAYQIQSLMAAEYSNINNIGSIPLSAGDLTNINNRLNAFNGLISTIYPLPFAIPFAIDNITSGVPAIQPYDLLSYMVQYNLETPPTGLTEANFFTKVQSMATAWQDALNYLGSNGNNVQLIAYNACDRMAACTQDLTNFLNNITLAVGFTTTELTQLWNSLVALPSLLRVASVLYNDPSSQSSQSINVLKFTLFKLIYLTNAILASFTVPNNLAAPITSQLRSGESLLDFAARTTGDFSQWQAIATANALEPPYISATLPTGTASLPNTAIAGQKLFLPPFSVTEALASYGAGYLGSDINIGLPYGTFPNWTGDFDLITGIDNYIGALARRVLTTQGNLLYHTGYGSQLPPQIGQISTSNEALLLSSYLKSALNADPRTQTVNQITAYSTQFGSIVMTALVTPFGNAAQAAPFNLVVIPKGTSITSSASTA